MKTLLGILLGAVIASASALKAGEFTGGSIGVSYSAFTQDGDFDHLSLEGSAEFAFGRQFSGQFDVGSDRFGASDLEALTLGVHGIYHLTDVTSLGAFYTREDVEFQGASSDVNIYGVEARHDAGQLSFAGFLGYAETQVDDGGVWGLATRYTMANDIGVSGLYEHIDVNGLEGGKVALRLDGDVSANLNMFVEVGSAKARAFGVWDSEPYVGLGGKLLLGPNRGATFEQRGLSRVLPGL
tara:strand:- start:907 stop:1626 length:720 start_codon:yes stop_codon:yes gene_type:complete